MIRRGEGEVLAILVIVILLCLGVGSLMFVIPQYNLWRAGVSGQATLREAESTRQVAVLEARAKMEASKLLAEAEVERAKGVAQANKIIGEGLKDNHEYLLYLWIHELGQSGHVIYVPTEANLPILEAGRFQKPIK